MIGQHFLSAVELEFLLIGLLLVSISGVGNVKRKKDAKRQANNEDNIPFDLPNYGYDSSARHLPTELEKEVEMDEVEIAKIQAGADRVREEGMTKKTKRQEKEPSISHYQIGE